MSGNMVPWGHSVSLSGWWHIEPCLARIRCQEVIQSHCLDDGQLDCHKWPATPIGVIGTFSDTLWEECRTLLLSFLDNYLPNSWLNILNIHNTNASLQTCMSFLVMSCHVTSCHVMLCKTVRLSRQSGCQDSHAVKTVRAWLSWQPDYRYRSPCLATRSLPYPPTNETHWLLDVRPNITTPHPPHNGVSTINHQA